jgi:hypothetical protein
METRTLTLSLTALAVVAVATSNARPSPGRAEPQSVGATDSARPAEESRPPSPSAKAEGYAPGSGEKLLHDFFGTHWDSTSTAAPDTFQLRVLIATVPDPYDSHMDWSFDAMVEAIRRALETAGFVTDRFWFPGARDSTDWGAAKTRVLTREVRPAVMLLRQTALHADTLLLLYLVPELPTRGIYKAALRTALEERFALQRHHDLPLRSDLADPIRIIGPTFSGSAVSLQLVVRGWAGSMDSAKQAREPVEIVTGSATGLSNLATLNCRQLRMRFRATINPDQALDRLLADEVLPRLGLHPSDVALLRESSTQYGRGLVDVETRGAAGSETCRADAASAPSPGPDAGFGSARVATPDSVHSPAPEGQFVIIPFPMSISSLRSEYQRVPAGALDQPPLPGATEAPRLPLDLLDPARPKEDLPVTSRLSPVALDLILDEVARTLTRRQIRLVGLLATDVRDKLFLGDEIRKRVRDVQFFTYESNVLYLRSDRSEALRGMLVFSTYPLILENQWMSAATPASQRFAFGSDGAEGVYNATLLQLGDPGAMQDYRTGRRESAVPRPPVWLTTVGNRAFQPVLRYEGGDSTYVASGCPPVVCHGQTAWPRGLPFLSLATIILSSFGLVLFGRKSLKSDAELRSSLGPLEHALALERKLILEREFALSPEPRPKPVLGRPVERPFDLTVEYRLARLREQVLRGSLMLHDRLYGLLRLMAVLGIFLATCAPMLRLAHLGLVSSRLPEGVYLLLTPIVLGAAVFGVWVLGSGTFLIVRLSRYLWTPAWEYFRVGPFADTLERWTWRLEVAARTVVALFGVALLAESLQFAIEIWGLERSAFWLFFRRAVELDSLVSPVTPLVLGGIGYVVWCSWHIERIALLKVRTTFESVCEAELDASWSSRVTFGSALRDDLMRTATVTRLIRSRLFQVVPTLGAIGVLVAFGCLLPWLWPRFGRSLEAILTARSKQHVPAFDVLFRAMVVASMFATAWGAYRLIAVWDGLRQCLTGFSRMPIVTAFDRLPARLSRLTRLTLPGFAPAASAGAVADIQWLHLQRIYALRKSEFSAALLPYNPDLIARIDELMGMPAVQPISLDRAGRRGLIGRFIGLHHILRELWRMEPMPEELEKLIDGLGKEIERVDVAAGATSTTVRIRRGFAGPVRLWLRAAEEYAASRMVEYIEWVIRHLRVLALFMLVSLLLTTMLVSSYPYQPQSLLRLILLLVLAGSVGSIVVVLVQTNRDEVLSRIVRTEPGRVTWNGTFIVNLFTFGVLPLLTLLSSEFPGLRVALFAWVQPLVNAVAKQ